MCLRFLQDNQTHGPHMYRTAGEIKLSGKRRMMHVRISGTECVKYDQRRNGSRDILNEIVPDAELTKFRDFIKRRVPVSIRNSPCK